MADNIRIDTFENFILKNSGNFFKNISEPVNKKVGWFCTYVPEEIITAAGFIPERITGQEKAKKAESYFPINFCSFIKCAMEDLLGFIENENNVSGLIFTNSCDGMRRFYDMCKSYVRSIPCFMLDVPRIKNNLSLRQFSNNIKKMAVFLNDIGGQNIDSGSIEKSIKLHGEKRMLLTRLHSLFKKYPDSVGISNYFNIIKYAMTSEPVLFTMQLEKYLRAAEAETEGIYLKDSNAASDKKPHHTASPPVMLIGNFIYEVKLWEMLDELHCNLSAVDTCSGERYFKKTDYGVEAEIISGVTGNQ
ncbi:MAG: 2-hydroxyacyl-CoA dehydratase, partial [Actinobacteria bacterium]|nr:2-hydroxyacyl-CoA dehydratase [Actinomycetota bacterium]